MRSRRLKKSVASNWDCDLLDIFYSEKTDRTIVMYELGDGQFGDLATTIMRRTAWFVGRWKKDLRTEIQKVLDDDRLYYYEGLPEALADHEWEAKQTADEMAEKARDEERELSDTETPSYWRGSQLRQQQERYAAMMEALDKLENAPDDEAAMDAIYAAREQYAMLHEK